MWQSVEDTKSNDKTATKAVCQNKKKKEWEKQKVDNKN